MEFFQLHGPGLSSRLHRASIVSKTLFIVTGDAHSYKIIETLKQFTNFSLFIFF